MGNNNGGVYTWSQTPANNANADLTVNWAPQMAPSGVAPSGRAMMASVAKWRDDISGLLVTSGTSTAYTLASNQIFDTLSDMDGKIIAFTPHVTNGAGPVYLDVDGLNTNAYLRSAPNVDLPAGVIIQGTPYVAIFKKSDNAFYLQGFYANPYNIPIGASVEWWSSAVPNSCFAFPYGQAISRTTYVTLFAWIGTIYGSGDGSTTFNLPDLRGRVVGCMDNMGGGDAGRLSDTNSSIAGARNTLGGVGGSVTHAVNQNEMPSHYHGINWSDPGHTHSYAAPTLNQIAGASNLSIYDVMNTQNTGSSYTGITFTGAGGANTTLANGGSATHENVQPTILANRILRII